MSVRTILGAAVVALGVLPATAFAQAPSGSTREIELETIPAVSGLELQLPTGTYRTNSRGKVRGSVKTVAGRVSKNPDEYRTLPDGAVFKAPVLTRLRLPNTGMAKLERFYGG